MRQLHKFILVGILNTGWGYFLIFSFMLVLKLSPEVSNFLGYGIALITSYTLNRNITFNSLNAKTGEFFRFLIVFALAYATNFAVLLCMIYWLKVNVIVSQVVAGFFYIAISYLLNKYFVFISRHCVRQS